MLLNILLMVFILLLVLCILVGIRSSLLGDKIIDGFFDWVGYRTDYTDPLEWDRRLAVWRAVNVPNKISFDFRIWSFNALLKQLGEEPFNK